MTQLHKNCFLEKFQENPKTPAYKFKFMKLTFEDNM